MNRAILSAPPPLPAMITISTGFFGSQASAELENASMLAASVNAPAARTANVHVKGFISMFPPLFVLRGSDLEPDRQRRFRPQERSASLSTPLAYFIS